MTADSIILGINAYHADAAACLVRGGSLVAAAEEERFRRIKHWAGFPSRAIGYCLHEARIELSDVTHVAVNRSSRTNFLRKLTYLLGHRPNPRLLLSRLRNRKQIKGIAEDLGALPGRRFAGTIEHVEHHLAHLASAFYPSPFREAVVVSVDGFGDFASAAWGSGTESALTLDGRVLFPHSLGIFYQAMTQYLGFPHYGDEYKLMGLAAYGDKSCHAEVGPLLSLRDDGSFSLDLKYFRHPSDDIAYEWHGGEPVCGPLFSQALVDALGPQRTPDAPIEDRHRNLAWATQAVYEEAFFHLLNTLQRRYGHSAVALAGGCAYNSVANGKIRDRTAFRHCYLQSAAGDAGGAIGAAYAVWHRTGSRAAEMTHAFWGPSFTAAEFGALLSDRHTALEAEGCGVRHIVDESELVATTARAIADGLVIGWFQGRMEWGPRALGNRSILGDPRRADMKNILNAKIKRRESFRPFAPSVLREAVADWFERDDDVPFMLQVFPIRPERRAQIPAVTHVDGTGRLQTVDRAGNPRYYAVIEAFSRLTGVPMVLNTSFNENEPVVCRPEEALDCFLRTKMDVLVLGDYFVQRRSGI
ncbi:MAG TPA: carbamoyltransferase C-terminal domain-containing protein [Steroidobacteraceae bacterium]|nr:carbamoyltransferase C-terminal domain-containing protein [Steroidobacteraceae bacterium]